MKQYIGFTLDDAEYTIPILKVREIINMPSITKMPRTPSYIEGVMNIRGCVMPVLNLKKLTGIYSKMNKSYSNDSGYNDNNKVIIVSNEKITFGVIVDRITGVIAIDESSIEKPDEYIFNNGHIDGIAKLTDRLVVMIDTKRLIPSEEVDTLKDIVDSNAEIKGSQKNPEGLIDDTDSKIIEEARDFFAKGVCQADPKYAMLDEIMEFMDGIANNDYNRADIAYQNILKKGQGDLFNEIGRVTRKLHDSLRSFKEAIDPKLRDMAILEMPNAVDRLQFVIEKTEEAANRTMGIVEKYILSMDELSSHIRKIKEPEESVEYLKRFKNSLEDDFTEILTTQSFQDITGQAIKKVIRLVTDIEEELVKLIKTFGVKIEEGDNVEAKAYEKVSQSDVDELLREFGF